jgi:hypothetical protein
MNFKVIISLWIGSLLLASTLSFYVTRNYYTSPLPNPNVPLVSPIQSPVVPMPKDLSCELAKSELFHYNNDMPTINVVILEQTRTKVDVMVDGALYQRKFLTEVSIPLVQAESSNWRFGLGVTVGAIAVVGVSYGAVKLYERFH